MEMHLIYLMLCYYYYLFTLLSSLLCSIYLSVLYLPVVCLLMQLRFYRFCNLIRLKQKQIGLIWYTKYNGLLLPLWTCSCSSFNCHVSHYANLIGIQFVRNWLRWVLFIFLQLNPGGNEFKNTSSGSHCGSALADRKMCLGSLKKFQSSVQLLRRQCTVFTLFKAWGMGTHCEAELIAYIYSFSKKLLQRVCF